jgi:hypothetical protein
LKGLISIPDLKERESAYRSLESTIRGELHPSAIQWALWSQWTRFDPRLGELWVKAFSVVWKSLEPLQLREALLRLPWPACAGVLLLQVNMHLLPPPARPLFRAWSKLALEGIPKAENELYFIGVFSFAGTQIQKEATSCFKSFSRWGFLGQATFVNKASNEASGKTDKTEMSPAQRRTVLNDLISRHSRLTVGQYISSLPEGVGIRQAQLDLASHPRLKAVGNTRGRFYRRKAKKQQTY